MYLWLNKQRFLPDCQVKGLSCTKILLGTLIKTYYTQVGTDSFILYCSIRSTDQFVGRAGTIISLVNTSATELNVKYMYIITAGIKHLFLSFTVSILISVQSLPHFLNRSYKQNLKSVNTQRHPFVSPPLATL